MRGEIEKYMSVHACPDCKGRRLRPEALAVTRRRHGRSTSSRRSPVAQLRRLMTRSRCPSASSRSPARSCRRSRDRLGFLDDVGVGYLTLDRASATLSGGESQRIRLATQIGSKLMGVLYVLDEPSIGLHQRDNRR